MIDLIQFEMWQDIVFMIGGFTFAAILIPTLRDPSSQIPLTTSIPTAFMLIIYIFTFVSLGMILSALAQMLSAIAWICIAIWRSP